MIQTEFPFTLPKGFVDGDGTMHREGIMRLATAFDEIAPMKDPRVQANPAYLVVILLSRVITKLGTVDMINPKAIEGLYAADLAFLQDFYNRINGDGRTALKVQCPHCDKTFDVETGGPGGSPATPSTASTGR